MKIRAAVLERFGEPLVVQEVELAEPCAGEVLVRLVACGVCHTDLYTASGADPSGYAPAVLGHEGAGMPQWPSDRIAKTGSCGTCSIAIPAADTVRATATAGRARPTKQRGEQDFVAIIAMCRQISVRR
jgi:hypothetical protein